MPDLGSAQVPTARLPRRHPGLHSRPHRKKRDRFSRKKKMQIEPDAASSQGEAIPEPLPTNSGSAWRLIPSQSRRDVVLSAQGFDPGYGSPARPIVATSGPSYVLLERCEVASAQGGAVPTIPPGWSGTGVLVPAHSPSLVGLPRNQPPRWILNPRHRTLGLRLRIHDEDHPPCPCPMPTSPKPSVSVPIAPPPAPPTTNPAPWAG